MNFKTIMDEFLDLLNRCPFPYPLTTIGGIILLFVFLGYLFRDKPEKPLIDPVAVKIKSLLDSVPLDDWRESDRLSLVYESKNSGVSFANPYYTDSLSFHEAARLIENKRDLKNLQNYCINLVIKIKRRAKEKEKYDFLSS
jgi:hypothetical protein